ncbi:hypothetical protein ACU21_09320 [Actinobaculum suis]|nr:hypothetical protein ACU21_09320 [Actinobaculum suis]OCA96240.1 hypothetical protein ACU20_02610 [Actinobaculum suis]
MAAAVIKRQDMVDFLRWSDKSSCLAVFTQWMGGDVAVPDLAPFMIVAAVDFGIPLVAAVLLVVFLGMRWAVPAGG